MKAIVAQYSHDLDVYLSMVYLLMNLLLVEEDYERNNRDYYAQLIKYYFDSSYSKFSNDPRYLFYMARIACMSEWYVGIELEDVEKMLQKAYVLDPENMLYQWAYYSNLDKNHPQNKNKIIAYSKQIFQLHSPAKIELQNHGSLGRYILDMMEHSAKKMVTL